MPTASEDGESGPDLSTLRTFRVLRPLKLVSGVPSKSLLFKMNHSMHTVYFQIRTYWSSKKTAIRELKSNNLAPHLRKQKVREEKREKLLAFMSLQKLSSLQEE